MWRFPKIGVPPNHPVIDGFSPIDHLFYGVIYGNLHLSIINNLMIDMNHYKPSSYVVSLRNHPYFDRRFSHINHPFLGYPMTLEAPNKRPNRARGRLQQARASAMLRLEGGLRLVTDDSKVRVTGDGKRW